MKHRLAAAALLALLPLAARADAGPRTPAPFTIVPLVELATARGHLAAMHSEPAVMAIDRAARALERTRALAGTARSHLADNLLMQVTASRMAVADMRDAEALALLGSTIAQLRSQPHY